MHRCVVVLVLRFLVVVVVVVVALVLGTGPHGCQHLGACWPVIEASWGEFTPK